MKTAILLAFVLSFAGATVPAGAQTTRTAENVEGMMSDLMLNDPIALTSLSESVASELETTASAVVGLAARRDAIESNIRDLSEQAETKIAGDQIAQELAKVAQMKQAIAEQKQSAAHMGAAGITDAMQAQSDAIQAKIALLERQEAVAAAVGGGMLPRLNQELINVSIDLAEKEGTLNFLRSQEARLANLRSRIGRH